MDFGAAADGYCADITRTVIVGKANDEQRAVYDIVRQANELAASEVRAGLKGREADAVAHEDELVGQKQLGLACQRGGLLHERIAILAMTGAAQLQSFLQGLGPRAVQRGSPKCCGDRKRQRVRPPQWSPVKHAGDYFPI